MLPSMSCGYIEKCCYDFEFPIQRRQRAQQWEQNRSYCVSGSQVSSLPLATATTTGLPFRTVFYVCRAPASATAYCATLQAAYTVPQPLEWLKPSLGIGLATGVHSPVRDRLAFTFSNVFSSLPKPS